MEKSNRDWHRWFGLLLTDFFTGSPFHVELERDLSKKKQLLDVVVVRRDEGVFTEQLPDGLEDLVRFNLITFKSFQEPLDDWALKELTGHYVNYRKQEVPSGGEMWPEPEFRLFAVCARYPHNLAGQVPWARLRPGVYDCRRGTDTIRVVVVAELPQTDNNAMLHLFSASQELVRYGAEHYRKHSAETSSLLDRLIAQYRKEGVQMSYTMEDFKRDYRQFVIEQLTPEEIRAAFPPEKLLAGLSPEQVRAAVPLEKLLEGISPEEITAVLKRLQAGDAPPRAE
jgi:hypothetical protein